MFALTETGLPSLCLPHWSSLSSTFVLHPFDTPASSSSRTTSTTPLLSLYLPPCAAPASFSLPLSMYFALIRRELTQNVLTA